MWHIVNKEVWVVFQSPYNNNLEMHVVRLKGDFYSVMGVESLIVLLWLPRLLNSSSYTLCNEKHLATFGIMPLPQTYAELLQCGFIFCSIYTFMVFLVNRKALRCMLMFVLILHTSLSKLWTTSTSKILTRDFSKETLMIRHFSLSTFGWCYLENNWLAFHC